MGKIIEFFSNKKVVLLSFLGTTVFIVLMIKFDEGVSGNNGMGIAYLQLSFDKINYETIISTWGKKGVDFFLNNIWINFLYSFFMSMLLVVAGVFFLAKESNKDDFIHKIKNIIVFLPALIFIMDFIGTAINFYILENRVYNNSLIFSASLAFLVKWFLFIINLAIIGKKFFELKKTKTGIITKRSR